MRLSRFLRLYSPGFDALSPRKHTLCRDPSDGYLRGPGADQLACYEHIEARAAATFQA